MSDWPVPLPHDGLLPTTNGIDNCKIPHTHTPLREQSNT